MTRRPGPPSNDNEPPERRRIVDETLQYLPILESELALVEAHFSAMIEKLRRAVANDDGARPPEETWP